MLFKRPPTPGMTIGKWEPRLLPCVFLGYDLGPGAYWGRCYIMVPIQRLLAEDRPSRATVVRGIDVVFPQTILRVGEPAY